MIRCGLSTNPGVVRCAFRALSRRHKFTDQRHKFNKDSLSRFSLCGYGGGARCGPLYGSGVAPPATTNHAAKGSVFVNLESAGNLENEGAYGR